VGRGVATAALMFPTHTLSECVYVCVCKCVCLCLCVCIWGIFLCVVKMGVDEYTCVRMNIFVCMCVCVHVYMCMSMSMCIYMCIQCVCGRRLSKGI
jgi:hypothetical protein